MWRELADSLLGHVTSAGVQVAREIVAPGPDFAHDCRLLAVHLGPVTQLPLQRQFPGSCATVTQIELDVTFVADCVPVGNPTPDQVQVTEWSDTWIRDVEMIHRAILDWIDEPTGAASLGVVCESISMSQAIPSGPTGGTASIVWPLNILVTV